MVHKEKKEKKKTLKTPMTLTFSSIVATNDKVDPVEFVKNGNEYLAEPINADGCIVVFKLMHCEINKKDSKKPQVESSEKLDKYMHFTFRGIRFTVDTEDRSVQCNGAGLAQDMAGGPDEDGLYHLNVETSN